MKFFASALLLAAADAAPRINSYRYVPEIRYRQVPVTVYDTVYETKYKDVARTEYRDVEETYQVDVPITKRLLHEHSSDGDSYDSSDYKNTHSHGSSSDYYGFGQSKYLDSDYSDEIHYEGDDSRVGSDSSSSSGISYSSDVTG